MNYEQACEKMNQKHKKFTIKEWDYIQRKSKLWIKTLYFLGCISWYGNGDGDIFNNHLRMWHPLSILLVLLLLIHMPFFCLVTECTIMEYTTELWGFMTVHDFFKKHPEKLVWYHRNIFSAGIEEVIME